MKPDLSDLRVDFARLRDDIDTLAAIGRDESDGALYRMAFSDGDMAGREWLTQRIRDAGLEPFIDGAANIHGRLGWDAARPTVAMGSHIDTVPGGGHLDGALGVLVGLECVRRVGELGLKTRFPLEVIAFTDEEGRFGGMFGSQAVCGLLNPEMIRNARDLDGVTLMDAMAARGLNAMDALTARRPPETLRAFLELHIEQGPVLDRNGVGIGVVEAITGLIRWEARLIGVPNHAGTTPMDMRHDPLGGLAEFVHEIPRILEEDGSSRSVATVGYVQLQPGAANTVPGRADFSLDIRDTDPVVLDGLSDACRRVLSAIARRRGLKFEFDITSRIEPVRCDPGVVETIDAVARAADVTALRMPSGAAHDTQLLARENRAGMIFVPSKEGRSHSPAEWTALDDIENGANIALQTLLHLAEADEPTERDP